MAFLRNISYIFPFITLKQQISISKPLQIVLFLFLAFAGLYFAREFLIPLAFGGILATLILPLSYRLERKGLHKGLAAALCILILLLITGGIIALLIWQISDVAKDFSQIQEQVMKLINRLENSISSALGISKEKQQEVLRQQQATGSGGVTKAVSGLLSSLVDFVLVVVYTFLFVYFRDHLKKFILKLVPAEDIGKTEKIINESARVSYQYLSGLAMMIVMLWVLYGIGFSIVGIKSALFFAVLCGILEIVPFVGNLTGTSITVLMAISQGGGGGMVAGVLGTYLVIQFVQTYILEPLVVGAEVNINPLFTIMVLVLGELLWGIPGMVLAIPLLGITKIICDNIEPLKPYAFLIGGDGKKAKSGKWKA